MRTQYEKHYRSDIDGLRAFAVIAVILYHAEFSWISGGFIGVDIFFVISGYLITNIIKREFETNNFQLVDFYQRRIRRILPALCVVLFVTTPVYLLISIPQERVDFAFSVVAALGFYSNIFFYSSTGYFQLATESMPLVHTWSLAIEEQYYLLFPLVFVFLLKRGLTLPGLLVIFVISFLAANYFSVKSPSFNFYSPLSRAFELILGASLASQTNIAKRNKVFRETATLCGLVCIVVSFYVFHRSSGVPNWLLILPLTGVALLLVYGGTGTFVCRVLSLPAIRFVGLISYSLYLWHQPVFTIAKLNSEGSLDVFQKFILIIFVFLLSYISWRFVEERCRKQKVVSNRVVFSCLAVSYGLLIVMALHVIKTQGYVNAYVSRLTGDQAILYKNFGDEQSLQGSIYDNGDCQYQLKKFHSDDFHRLESCKEKYGPGVLVLGDSHSMNIYNALRGSSANSFFVGVGRGGFRPIGSNAVGEYNLLLSVLKKEKLFETVLYNQAGFYFFDTNRGLEARRTDFVRDLDSLSLSHPRIEGTSHYLQQLAVVGELVVLGPKAPPFVNSRKVHAGVDYDFATARYGEILSVYDTLDEGLKSQLEEAGIAYISQIDALDFNFRRDFKTDKNMHFIDYDHWSKSGETYFAPRILSVVEKYGL